jgi:hypothetical protein
MKESSVRFAAIFLLLFLTQPSHAQQVGISGEEMLVPCSEALSTFTGQKRPTQAQVDDSLMHGMCIGLVNGVRFFAGEVTKNTAVAVCFPQNVSVENVMIVVVQFLQKNPARLREHFLYLALSAVSETWPCKK